VPWHDGAPISELAAVGGKTTCGEEALTEPEERGALSGGGNARVPELGKRTR